MPGEWAIWYDQTSGSKPSRVIVSDRLDLMMGDNGDDGDEGGWTAAIPGRRSSMNKWERNSDK